MRAVALAVVMILPAMAGCLELLGYDDPTLVPTDDPIPWGSDHNHADPEQHRFADGASLLDQLNLQEYGFDIERMMVGAHAMDTFGNKLVVAVFGNHDDTGGQQGFHIVDITEPENLRVVGSYLPQEPVRGDRTIAYGPEGKFVFLGYESGTRPGIAAVNVENPEDPRLAAFWSDPSGYGPHTVAAGRVDGTTYVFALSVGVTTLSFDGTTFQQVGKYVTADELAAADAARFVDPNSNDPTAYASRYALRTVYAHDMNFYEDPLTGTPLLLVAYAYDGLKILDISNPSVPVMLGRFLPPEDGTGHKHYTHSVTAERLETGELIIVAGSETFEEENQQIASPIWILDATAMMEGQPMENPPEHLSTWRNPSRAPAGALGLSVHFFRQQDGLLYLSHYHGGVWGIDLRTEADRNRPAHFAYIMPLGDDPVFAPDWCCLGWDLDGAPMVFDVAVDAQGTVYAADIVQGVSSIRMEPPSLNQLS